MNITLYKTTSDARDLDKVFTGTAKTISVTLKDTNDIMNPSFELSKGGITPDYNYLYIEEWNRYYFIRNIEYAQGGIVYIYCHIDVLMTYRSEIRNQAAIIHRNENSANLYLTDSEFPVENHNQIFYKKFPSGLDLGFSYYLSIGG